MNQTWLATVGEWGHGPLLATEISLQTVPDGTIRCTGIELLQQDGEGTHRVPGCGKELDSGSVFAEQRHVNGSVDTTCIRCAVECGGITGTTALIEARVWLTSEAGQRAVDSSLRGHGLSVGLHDDLVDVVLDSIARRLTDGKPIEKIIPFTRTCVIRAPDRLCSRIGLGRGHKRIHMQVFDENDNDDHSEKGTKVTAYQAEPAATPRVTPEVAQVQRAIEATNDESWRVSAALTFVSIIAHKARVGDGCPQPKAGATYEDAALWAGLWYAGRTECFIDPTRTRQAIDRDRARKCAQLRELMKGAAGDPS